MSPAHSEVRERPSEPATIDLAEIRAASAAIDCDRLATSLKPLSRADLAEVLTGDLFEDNFLLNVWEYATGAVILESYPWRIYLPVADSCNARCEFCTSWLHHDYFMKPEALDRLAEVLKCARVIDLCGYGEPLINPQLPAFVDALERYIDKRCSLVLFTNGALLDKWSDRLLDFNIGWVNISVNAASAATHEAVMGLGLKAFDRIIAATRALFEKSTARGKSVPVSLTFVVTSTNVHEAAKFVELCNTLPITSLYFRVLQQANSLQESPLNYASLPPYLADGFEEHRQRAVEAIADSKIPVFASPENWSLPVFPAEFDAIARTKTTAMRSRAEIAKTKLYYGELSSEPPDPDPSYNPLGRTPRFECSYVYHNLLINHYSFLISPCCYMNVVPGMNPMSLSTAQSFRDVWNGPQFTQVRRTLVEGPLLRNCKVCPLNK